MVLDIFENRELYYTLHSDFKEAFSFLEKCMLHEPELGKYVIRGDEAFAIVQQYETASSKDNKWEAHRKYIDIQFILDGQEIIEWANIEKVSENMKYIEDGDFLDCGEVKDGMECRMEKGYFSILYPADLHKPKCMLDKKCRVRKIVIKIAL